MRHEGLMRCGALACAYFIPTSVDRYNTCGSLGLLMFAVAPFACSKLVDIIEVLASAVLGCEEVMSHRRRLPRALFSLSR
jgi:hypothetical protein